jgi:nitric oxide reductase NorD protein
MASSMGRRVKGRLAGLEAALVYPHGCRHAPCRSLPWVRAPPRRSCCSSSPTASPRTLTCDDERQLIEDSRARPCSELDQHGIYPYCINLDAKADDYVRDIFGKQYSVIDRVERLPERLPQLFLALTG